MVELNHLVEGEPETIRIIECMKNAHHESAATRMVENFQFKRMSNVVSVQLNQISEMLLYYEVKPVLGNFSHLPFDFCGL